jgi:hypothetical protein
LQTSRSTIAVVRKTLGTWQGSSHTTGDELLCSSDSRIGTFAYKFKIRIYDSDIDITKGTVLVCCTPTLADADWVMV